MKKTLHLTIRHAACLALCGVFNIASAQVPSVNWNTGPLIDPFGANSGGVGYSATVYFFEGHKYTDASQVFAGWDVRWSWNAWDAFGGLWIEQPFHWDLKTKMVPMPGGINGTVSSFVPGMPYQAFVVVKSPPGLNGWDQDCWYEMVSGFENFIMPSSGPNVTLNFTPHFQFPLWTYIFPPSPVVIPGAPNLSVYFLQNATQTDIDTLVGALTNAIPGMTSQDIAQKFENADLFGFTVASLLAAGNNALVLLDPQVTIGGFDVSLPGLTATFTLANGIDPTAADALARLQSVLAERLRGMYGVDLATGLTTEIWPELTLDTTTGAVTATFTLNTAAPCGFLRLQMAK